ncbi:ATP-binding cassette sub-family G member 1-like isoform X6 [Rhynchophorus ferrugineus]|uniref:ATP-binding cassette sub-family G member 1-like isoform X6 n=1 Tax=Rhynchophorus ferrugineus TaxID=354439 RepID=UPI003FCD7851
MGRKLLNYLQTPYSFCINFEHVTFCVKEKEAYKKVIKGVCGRFKSGELTAIMGPSGAGKTSLLNILTGYQKSGVQGIIKCTNERKRKKDPVQYKNYSCYILQDDHLLDYFTVSEIMYSTTKLKIDGLSHEEREILIDDILSTLGLINQKNTQCGRLSGGQKKRLSIALELIDDPPIMFLDEPTTGLDSSSSRQCLDMLKSLAEKGRTIVCTIHQPSAPLYMMFDHIYAMADGRCIYQGRPEDTVSFLASQGFLCPQYHNPADFLMEVATGEYGESIEMLSSAVTENNSVYISRDEDKARTTESIAAIEPAIVDVDFSPNKPPSEWKRFRILLNKQLIYVYRDWTMARLKFLLHFLVGLFLGATYQKSGYDASRTITNVSFFLVSVVYLSYTSLMPAVLRFPLEIAILKKEHFNRWYKLRTYYASFLAADTPLQIIFTLAYTVGSYLISSQPLELYRFAMVFFIQSMAALISSGMGTVFGTLVNPVNGTFLSAVLTAVNVCLAGFLCTYPHMNKIMYFVSNFLYMSFCLESIIQAIYGYNRENLICPEEETYCMYKSPKELLREVGMENVSYWVDVGWLMLNLLLFRALGFLALKYKLRNA